METVRCSFCNSYLRATVDLPAGLLRVEPCDLCTRNAIVEYEKKKAELKNNINRTLY